MGGKLNDEAQSKNSAVSQLHAGEPDHKGLGTGSFSLLIRLSGGIAVNSSDKMLLVYTFGKNVDTTYFSKKASIQKSRKIR